MSSPVPEPFDAIVNLYQAFRENGQPVETAWRWACLVAAELAEDDFRRSVQADLDQLEVTLDVA